MPGRSYDDEDDDDDDDLSLDGVDDDLDEAEQEDPAPRAAPVSKLAMGLARRVRNLRERRGLTQDEFASRCGISVSFASLLERGVRNPSFDTLVAVAEALEVPLSELFKEEGLEPLDDPYHGRLLDFAKAAKLSHVQVDRYVAVGHAMFDVMASQAKPPERVLPTTCTVAGCGKRVLARGLCSSHYHKHRREKV